MTGHEHETPQNGEQNGSLGDAYSLESDTSIVSRRDMIRIMVGAGISVAAALALAGPISPATESLLNFFNPEEGEGVGSDEHHWTMVIDLSKCIGCDFCVYACQATNDVPDDMRWNIRRVDATDTGNTFHVTRPCLHCDNAPCVYVCPVGATFVREDGIVVMDYDKCMGCRYCQAACPYGARVFNWDDREENPNPYAPEWGSPEVPRRARGVVEKCTFCTHRIDPGLERGLTPGVDPEATPACVVICPVEARFFGDLNDPDSEVSRILNSTSTFRLREDLGTEPSVYYIPPEGLI